VTASNKQLPREDREIALALNGRSFSFFSFCFALMTHAAVSLMPALFAISPIGMVRPLDCASATPFLTTASAFAYFLVDRE
jgi:hypothetical protein